MAKKTPKPASIYYEYTDIPLDETLAPKTPLPLFRKWFDEAVRAGVPMPHAMILSTVTARKRPEARTVLLKDFGARGFTFYTNYRSGKGKELKKSPWSSLIFYWPRVERQIRITGKTQKISPTASERYFKSRPRGYQLGAWVSPQSDVIPGRPFLESRVREVEEKFHGRPVPRPPWWGGYVIKPDCFEFWQGRANRLHDRLRYQKQRTGRWRIERLAP